MALATRQLPEHSDVLHCDALLADRAHFLQELEHALDALLRDLTAGFEDCANDFIDEAAFPFEVLQEALDLDVFAHFETALHHLQVLVDVSSLSNAFDGCCDVFLLLVLVVDIHQQCRERFHYF